MLVELLFPPRLDVDVAALQRAVRLEVFTGLSKERLLIGLGSGRSWAASVEPATRNARPIPAIRTPSMIGQMASSRQPADSHDLIRVHGARENNPENISVELPKRRLTVFTGVSIGQVVAGIRNDRGELQR